jgi:hypothetical protein
MFESVPWAQTLFSLGCHAVYGVLLNNFPFIQLTDPTFIVSCVLALANHFSWFTFFTSYHSFRFAEISAIFAIVVWLVPFQLFISLSASEYTLPNTSDPALASKKQSKLIKTLLNYILQKKEELLPTKDTTRF